MTIYKTKPSSSSQNRGMVILQSQLSSETRLQMGSAYTLADTIKCNIKNNFIDNRGLC